MAKNAKKRIQRTLQSLGRRSLCKHGNLLPHPMKRAVAHVAPMGLQKCAQELNTLSDIDNNRLPAIDSKIQMTFQKIRQRTLQASQPVAIG